MIGEVGRGTFISGQAPRAVTTLTEPRGARIDLEVNYPLLPAQAALISKSLEGLERPEALEIALRQGTSTGTQAATYLRAVVSVLLSLRVVRRSFTNLLFQEVTQRNPS